jgi:hypothetical protein
LFRWQVTVPPSPLSVVPPNAKVALFRWQVTVIPAIAMAIQFSIVQETVSRFGRQKFCADFGPLERF